MFLLDGPVVSDFIFKTIKENNYPVLDTREARNFANDDSLNWISSEDAIRMIRERQDTRIYTNSENTFEWFAKNQPDSYIYSKIKLFKDKFLFRELLRSIYPDLLYRKIELNEIQGLSFVDIGKPFVIKPAVGFFSVGVQIIHSEADLENAKQELNYEKLKSIYPSSVIDIDNFIIEEFIGGEEFAIDSYFNDNGEAIIMNIMHHRFSSGSDTSDRIYTTSKEMILEYHDRFRGFLQQMGDKAELRNFPSHTEIRIDETGRIVPIEVNPLRYGGWCTTGDILGVSLGFNQYEHYIRNKKPDWDEIFRGKENKLYSLIALNNTSGHSLEDIKAFDHELLAEDLESPMDIRIYDHHEYPLFGIVFTETSKSNSTELDELLVSDLKKYMVIK